MEEVKCPSCGSPNVEQIDTDKYQCPYCGKTFTTRPVATAQYPQQPVFNNAQNSTPDVDDNPGCLMNGLCFIMPLLGLVMFFVKKETQPKCAKSYLIWGIAGFVIQMLYAVLPVVLMS